MPNTCCDLHMHSHYSDGRASPAELLHHAASLGLRVIAITDHENFNAYTEAERVASRLGIELIPGIELSSRWEPCPERRTGNGHEQDVDVLGYDFDPLDAAFREFTRLALEDLQERTIECLQRLNESGCPVSEQEVKAENPRYTGGMQLITALQRSGYAKSWNEALALFNAHWPDVRPARFSIQEVIQAIHAAGGAVVLAHPIQVTCGGGRLASEQVRQLAAMGLDGLEVLHPRLNAETRDYFHRMATEYHLLVTGGSDEHGGSGSFSRMGSELVTYEMVKALRVQAQTHK